MNNLVLASAGGMVFILTAWASLVFGYQVFQNMWEADQADSPPLAGVPTHEPAISLADAREGEAVSPIEHVHPVAPPA